MAKTAIWAFSYGDDRQQLRYYILTFSQCLLLAQLIATFVLQIPTIQADFTLTEYSMAFDMLGLLLHNLQKYNVALHHLAITFAISII